ncbi:hypothetical protein TWF281_006124 [Arthrobotrys megalospora]
MEAQVQAKTTVQLLRTLVDDPENDTHLKELKERIKDKDDNSIDEAAYYVKAKTSQPKLKSPISIFCGILIFSWIWSTLVQFVVKIFMKIFGPTTWSNYVGQQTCYPGKIRKPKNLNDLITAVNDAQQRKITLRAVGSGHSYSNVAPVFKGGLLLDPHGMNRVLPIDDSLLKDPQGAGKLFAVESGITIQDLNLALDKKKLALANMGAYDGQTIAGAISTGTHGTGIGLGPLASSVRAVVIVSGTGTVYQIEPTNGISDPEKFKYKIQDRTLKQDDEWFNTVLVSMGCTGIIYSYILEVVDAYYLEERRAHSSWEIVKKDLMFPEKGVFPKVLTDNRHYEVDINPYPVKNVHSCVIQTKNISKENKPSGSRGIADWIAGILAGCPLAEHWLVWALNLWPAVSPEIINNALNSLVEGHVYIDKSYKVLNLGAVNNVKAIAMEFSYPVDDNLVDGIDNLLSIFQDEADKNNWYMAGPFSLRFVAASDAYLAPQQGRPSCMVELDMLLGIETGPQLLTEITRKVQASNPEVRVHWGLDLDTVRKDSLVELYPELPKWLKVYAELNTMGVFDNPLTDRLDISVNLLA